jgi:hypothetical protein
VALVVSKINLPPFRFILQKLHKAYFSAYTIYLLEANPGLCLGFSVNMAVRPRHVLEKREIPMKNNPNETLAKKIHELSTRTSPTDKGTRTNGDRRPEYEECVIEHSQASAVLPNPVEYDPSFDSNDEPSAWPELIKTTASINHFFDFNDHDRVLDKMVNAMAAAPDYRKRIAMAEPGRHATIDPAFNHCQLREAMGRPKPLNRINSPYDRPVSEDLSLKAVQSDIVSLSTVSRELAALFEKNLHFTVNINVFDSGTAAPAFPGTSATVEIAPLYWDNKKRTIQIPFVLVFKVDQHQDALSLMALKYGRSPRILPSFWGATWTPAFRVCE